MSSSDRRAILTLTCRPCRWPPAASPRPTRRAAPAAGLARPGRRSTRPTTRTASIWSSGSRSGLAGPRRAALPARLPDRDRRRRARPSRPTNAITRFQRHRQRRLHADRCGNRRRAEPRDRRSFTSYSASGTAVATAASEADAHTPPDAASGRPDRDPADRHLRDVEPAHEACRGRRERGFSPSPSPTAPAF